MYGVASAPVELKVLIRAAPPRVVADDRRAVPEKHDDVAGDVQEDRKQADALLRDTCVASGTGAVR